MSSGSHGEAVIRRAFHISLAVILLLLVAAAVAWWLLHRTAPATRRVEEARVAVPQRVAETPADRPPSVHFTDITGQAGIGFVHVSGAYGERLMPETIGSGGGFIDYDNDGDPDLLLVNSRYWEGHEGEGTPTQALYRNDGNGRFTDVSKEAGLDLTLYGMGLAVGDYDNDGWQDIYITAVGRNRLLHNAQGRFVEVTDAAGVGGRESDWSTGAAFIDYDNDGDLDLYVANYVRWSKAIDLEIDFRLTGLGRAYGAPNHFVGVNGFLFRNEGGGRFTDVTRQAGIEVLDPGSGAPVGKGLGVAPVDYDGDGLPDLFVANDTVRNFLFHNLGAGRFEEVGEFEGIAYDRDGRATSGMGVDAAWFRNDRDLAFAVGNFANEMSSLYVSADGRPPFADEAVLEGLGPASRLALSFGMLFFDYDLDGRQDLLQANGHLEHEINKVQPSQHYAQPAQLFWNCGTACRAGFQLVTDPGDITQPLVGRGSAYADIDGDGDLDLLITQNSRRPALLRNDQATGHHWLRLKLVGGKVNRDAIGALVELSAGGVTQRRQVMPTHSYLSQSELVLTFGLGEAQRVDGLTVTWPGGQVQPVKVEGVDGLMVVEQVGD